jgi:2-polyprenyl-3-methyl-5-hydroxy-6-metoxy-1,4-benzoquinol methylase
MTQTYYSNIRYDLIELIENKEKVYSILEIGGGDFDTLKYLVNHYNAEGVGVDLRVPNAIANITFYQGNLDDLNFFSQLEGYKFDIVIAGDVLEHTLDPLAICQKIHGLLSTDGHFVISIPNIRNIKALYQIFVKGSFPKLDSGLFDRTHRSWFTYKDIVDMIEKSKFSVLKYKPLGRITKWNLKNKSVLSEFLALQHAFVLKKKN